MPSISGAEEADMLNAQDWTFPIPIAYGSGRLAEIGLRCMSLGILNPLVVTDRDSCELPFIAQLQRYLRDADISSGLFSDISPNPRDDEIGTGREKFGAGGHDAVIAIGGGSAMDGGKSICLTANNEVDLWAFEFEQPCRRLVLINPSRS